MSHAERFWAKVDRSAGPDACWPWSAYRFRLGYGGFRLDGRTVGAHRVAYALSTGRDPGEMHVLHRCDNPPCCNPAHLSLGTHQDNMADREAKGRNSAPPIRRGAERSTSKLDNDAVREMRRLRREGLTFASIATRFDVGTMTAWAAITGATWGHIEDDLIRSSEARKP